MTMKLSDQDKSTLHKFLKFLALKSTQLIVQSRLGQKDQTTSVPHSNTDWFNLNIQELPEVSIETKKALKKGNDLLSTEHPLCIEISLRTVDGDQMVLETWSLSLLPEQCDPTSRIILTVYNRMGILLKSLISVTRVTPAYKLSRRQGPESYIMCYRIYMDSPQLHTLGEGYKQVRIGQICTPIGTLQLSVAYRTKMTISPTHSGKENSIMLKSDHFNPINLSPRDNQFQENVDKHASLCDTIKIGAFADAKKAHYQPDLIIPEIPFNKFWVDKTPHKDNDDLVPLEKPTSLEDVKKEEVQDDKDQNGNEESKTAEITMVSTTDDFIMVDLKTPFASTNSNTELNKFFIECKQAPPLQEFQEVPTVAEQVQDLTQQLETFELDVNVYDTMVESLFLSPNN